LTEDVFVGAGSAALGAEEGERRLNVRASDPLGQRMTSALQKALLACGDDAESRRLRGEMSLWSEPAAADYYLVLYALLTKALYAAHEIALAVADRVKCAQDQWQLVAQSLYPPAPLVREAVTALYAATDGVVSALHAVCRGAPAPVSEQHLEAAVREALEVARSQLDGGGAGAGALVRVPVGAVRAFPLNDVSPAVTSLAAQHAQALLRALAKGEAHFAEAGWASAALRAWRPQAAASASSSSLAPGASAPASARPPG
jgi:hypothetical protein